MNLNEITANIRLRNPWEAIDLGFSMVQKWWFSLYLPLAIATFSIALLLYFIVPEDSFWITLLVFWWLKPLYDRIVLHVVSRKLFNQALTSYQVLTEIPSLIWNTGFFQSISFRRLSLSRGFNLPIWQLEQLRGPKRSARQTVLHQSTHTQAAWLTIGCVLLEYILTLSLFVLLAFLLPEKTTVNFFTSYFDNNVEAVMWVDLLNYLFYVCVVTIIHPFYISSSFALYINRRTQLEAWDLELEFRKMSLRLKERNKTSKLMKSTLPTILVSLCCIVHFGAPSPVYADEIIQQSITNNESLNDKKLVTEILAPERQAPETSKSVIKEAMLVKELNDKKVVSYWAPKKSKDDKKKKDKDLDSLEEFFRPIAKIMGGIIEFGLWILLAIGIFMLIYYRDSWLSLFNYQKKIDHDEYQAPEVMFGMDVRPDSLPSDIISEFRALWQSEKPREALSLLYRAALVTLINQDHVQLENSHTENDVLRISNKTISKSKQDYLSQLTSAWREIAYAHRKPNESDIEQLLATWYTHFIGFEQGDISE